LPPRFDYWIINIAVTDAAMTVDIFSLLIFEVEMIVASTSWKVFEELN
jgi:hypothetical protein